MIKTDSVELLRKKKPPKPGYDKRNQVNKALKELIEICEANNEIIDSFTSNSCRNLLPIAIVKDSGNNQEYVLEYDREWYIL